MSQMTQDRLMWGLGQAGADWSWTTSIMMNTLSSSSQTTTGDTDNTVATCHDVSGKPGVNSSGNMNPSGPLDAMDDLYDYYWENLR